MEKLEDNERAGNSLKMNISYFVPSLLKITGDGSFGWGRINRMVNEKLEALKLDANGETIEVEANFFLTIIAARKGNSRAVGLLHFLNSMVNDLVKRLSPEELKLIRSNVKNLLSAFDLRFYDFVGEIASLNNLMQTNLYRLKLVEHPLPNGKKIDFLLQRLDNDTFLNIEIYNIRIDGEKIEDNWAAIERFLNYRLQNKIRNKTKGLEVVSEIHVIPVLWGSAEDLKIYSEHFKKQQLTMKNVCEPLAWLMRTDHKGYYEHKFAGISRLFNNW